MDKDYKNLHNEKLIDVSLKSGFGYADEQFLAEFHRAEQNPETYQYDMAGFQNLWSRLEENGFFIEKDNNLPIK